MVQIADLKMAAFAVMIVIGFWIIKAEPDRVGNAHPVGMASSVVEFSVLPG